MKAQAILLALFASPLFLSHGFSQGLDQNSEVIIMPSSSNLLQWYGHQGRTYFIQTSDPNQSLQHLESWLWAPVIEAGNDENISHEVGSTADRAFFRLHYTDDPLPAGETLESWDTDGDGLSNQQEVELATHKTNPLNPDTSGDGIYDGWASFFGLNPQADNAAGLFQGGPTTNLAAFLAGVQAVAGATTSDHDGDGIPNENDSDQQVPDEFRVVVVSELLTVSYGQGGNTSVTENTTAILSLARVFLRDPAAGVVSPVSFVSHDAHGGQLETVDVKIEATAISAEDRKVELVDILDDDYSSILKAVADQDIQTTAVHEFTIPAGQTTSQSKAIDPGVTTLNQNSGELSKGVFLIHTNIIPDSGQSGVIGDVVESNMGTAGQKHFVSPKRSPQLTADYIVVKAQDFDGSLFDKIFKWEGGEAVPGDASKRRVKRDSTGKTEVKIKVKKDNAEADLMNVWVTWATMTGRIQGNALSTNNDLNLNDFTMTQLGPHEVQWEWDLPQIGGGTETNVYHAFIAGIEWKSTIEPSSMLDLSSDVPGLTELEPKDPNPPTYDGGRTYYGHWDIPRDRKRTRITDGTILDEEQNWTLDDDSNGSRDEDPYEQASGGPHSSEIFSVDNPGASPIRKEIEGQPNQYIPDATSYEVNHVFQEWTRIRLGSKWYDVSDKMDWWSNASATRSGEDWTRDDITIGLGVQE